MSEVSVSLAMRIAQAFDRVGIRPGDVARRLGVVPSTVSGWLRGRREPDAATLIRIAESCWITTDELLGVPPTQSKAGVSPQKPTDELPPLARAIEEMRYGDWETLARTLAEAMAVRERSELVRAQALLVSQENIQTAMSEARARIAAANASGAYITDPAERARVIADARELARQSGEEIRAEGQTVDPVPQE